MEYPSFSLVTGPRFFHTAAVQAVHHDDDPLAAPVSSLWGVGPERARQLAKLEITTVASLLLHRPRRYEDRRNIATIRSLEAGQAALVRGTIIACGIKWYKKRSLPKFEFILDDGTALLYCHWWQAAYLEKVFAKGQQVVVYGTVREVRPRTMEHPETEIIEDGEEASAHFDRITPIYPLTEGLPQRWLRGLIWRTLNGFEARIPDPFPALVDAGFWSRARAIRSLHFPAELGEENLALQRLAMDELLALQLSIQTRRRNLRSRSQGLPCAGDNHLIKPFLARLNFKLTAAQTRVLREIRQDLGGDCPMRRLLQGDVGSGKTAVAACAALMALESGFDAAIMAPTGILAEQHYQTFSRWFGPLGIPVGLHVSGRNNARREAVTGPGLSIGTHALLESGYAPPKLGLVVIDEQHKFGVTQREALVRKGRYPHVLVMTATPIPRTLGLTLYGDLDVSVIDELPAGRGEIRTYVREPAALPKVWDFLRQKLQAGRQAYIVYPRLEESDTENGIKALLEEYEKIRAELKPARVVMAHGRLSPDERDAVMADFRANRAQVLLATSVIEVGVDVPNATVMVIENAERFGLAQLHQLRGRIGRGSHTSHCVLLASNKTPDALARLRVLADTTDGFKIAEADLALRGPGELCGQAQSGLPKFNFANLVTDLRLVEQAREIARQLLDAAATPASTSRPRI